MEGKWNLNNQYFYKNGKLNGEFKIWNQNRILCRQGNYVNNKLCGDYEAWDGEGKLKYHNYYRNDWIVEIIFDCKAKNKHELEKFRVHHNKYMSSLVHSLPTFENSI